MRLLFASDSFKGTISSAASARLLADAAHAVLGDSVEFDSVLMADGGEGTVNAVIESVGGRLVHVMVHNPIGEIIDAQYGIFGANAIIEMSAASGLPLVAENERNPLIASTYGTGELILDALNSGVNKIYIAIGGSATNDGGMGCMNALGVRFLDAEGDALTGMGQDLIKVRKLDDSCLDVRLKDVEITVLCDVSNPLCGREGATFTFGRQKGADDEMLRRLENGMENYRDVLKETYGIDADDVKGAGAAGGLGAALQIFLKGKMCSGVDVVMQLNGFKEKLCGVEAVITGEGRVDWQSCMGKVLSGVGRMCQQNGVPAYALVGCKGDGYEKIFDYGIEKVYSVTDIFSIEESMQSPEQSYLEVAKMMFSELAKK